MLSFLYECFVIHVCLKTCQSGYERGLRYQGNMELHVNQCNKSGCMGVYFLREQFRFCSDISVNLCKGGYGYTTR